VKVPPLLQRATCVLLLFVFGAGPTALPSAAAARRARPHAVVAGELYRADSLRPVGIGVPAEIELLLPDGAEAWPEAARRALADRVRREWVGSEPYGAVRTGAPVWLEYPLVTARQGPRVLIPVVGASRLPIHGRLEFGTLTGRPKQVVLLIDASSSANQKTRFTDAEGRTETLSVLEAEYRAVDHLLELLGDDWLEFGVIAFGEGTWPIAEPGASGATLRRRMAAFREERPRGEGRTDTICALWTAYDWLERAPEGVDRQIVLLTDGDLPHSGRFSSCERLRSRAGRETCEARRNQTICPAQGRIRSSDGRSDLKQLERLGRRLRKKVAVWPVVFEPDRVARAYRHLAEQTGGQFVQVPSVHAIEVALPPLVAGRIQAVRAKNLHSGEESADLLERDLSRFQGELALLPGPNDVELRVESDRGVASLFRFRIYSEEHYLQRFLGTLREQNAALETRSEQLLDEVRQLVPAAPDRELTVTAEDE
jgi:hypothetical protein